MADAILLDVDGVLNAYHSTAKHRKKSGHRGHVVAGYLLYLRPNDGARLRSIAPVVWATTWVTMPELDDIAEIVGLPRGLPRIRRPEYATGKSCGKLPAVRDYLTLDRDIERFAWIDDAIGYQDIDFVRETALDGGPQGCYVIPEPSEGLIEDHFRFLESHFA